VISLILECQLEWMVHLPDPRAPFQHHLALLALKNAGEEKKKRRKEEKIFFSN